MSNFQFAVVSVHSNSKQQQAVERPWVNLAGIVFQNVGTAFQNFGTANKTTKAPSRFRNF